MRWLKKVGLPYGMSTLVTYFVAGMLDNSNSDGLLSKVVELIAENFGYYATAWYCDRFLPAGEKSFSHGSESLKQMAVVECLDMFVRLGLLWFADYFPRQYHSLGVGLASSAADIIFTISFSKSHRLLEICGKVSESYLSMFSYRPEPLALRF